MLPAYCHECGAEYPWTSEALQAARELDFRLPDDRSAKIWRYMDLGKLLDLLESQTLDFPCVAKLAEEDPYEGMLGEATVARIKAHMELGEENQSRILRLYRDARTFICTSCWYLNEEESAAMWSLYVRGSEGLAVRTTIARLIESLSVEPRTVYVGLVQYAKYEKDQVGWNNVFSPALTKRLSFEHEKEVRAMLLLPDEFRDDGALRVRVQVEQLIERVVVAPAAPAWLGELVARLVRRLGYSLPVERSPLLAKPVY